MGLEVFFSDLSLESLESSLDSFSCGSFSGRLKVGILGASSSESATCESKENKQTATTGTSGAAAILKATACSSGSSNNGRIGMKRESGGQTGKEKVGKNRWMGRERMRSTIFDRLEIEALLLLNREIV